MKIAFNNIDAAQRSRGRRGTILVATMAVCFTLSAVVFVLARSMAVEAIQSANTAAAAQADAIEHGAEQYVMGLLNNAILNSGGAYAVLDTTTYTDDYFDGVAMGDSGWFWLMRPVYDDPGLPLFGLVDECSKLDLNYAAGPTSTKTTAYNALMMLPGMVDDTATAIVGWRYPDDGTGSESSYYSSLTPSYTTKNQPFEAVEELMMVRGITHDILWGDGTGGPLGVPFGSMASTGGAAADLELAHGWYDLVTIHAYSPPPPGGGGGGGGGNQPARGLINVNTAPPAVLYCLTGLQPGDVENIISARAQVQGVAGTTDTSWLPVGGNIANQITGQSYRYSADILAVSANGRAFKRVRIVIDASTAPVFIVYRRDLTEQGWPMDPQLLEQIRSGDLAGAVGTSTNFGGAPR